MSYTEEEYTVFDALDDLAEEIGQGEDDLLLWIEGFDDMISDLLALPGVLPEREVKLMDSAQKARAAITSFRNFVWDSYNKQP